MRHTELSTDMQKYLKDSDYLKKDIKRLGLEKNKLETEFSSTAKKVSDIKGEQISVEKKAKETVAKAEFEAKEIKSKARQIEIKANEKRSEVDVKLSETADIKRELGNLVKSNEGKEKNLILEKVEVDKIKSKLLTIVKMIKNEVG
ncbi:hypothetical protein LCGC14_1044120 [marine sediment metagenome]|uniref:Uncharacterized protein n=1 Tax=marine sediment metagenome TaxID=412755 RepID=A0A0F9Q8Z7_9ZZZZ